MPVRPRQRQETPRPQSRKLVVPLAIIAIIVVAAIGYFLWRGRSTPAAGAQAAPRASDIILITIDTLRADSVGFAGNTKVRTPFLDSLAAKGTVFTNAHAHNVITLPSHVNILTGLYPYQHGVHENAGFTLDPKHATLASLLRESGYATGAFVGAFPLDARFGLNHGFDVYDDNYGKGQASVDFIVQERRAGAVLEPAVKWWRSAEGRKRFLWVHLYDPHAPYLPPEPFLSTYRSNEYLGEVAYTDEALAKAIGPLLEANPNVLVVVTADHGESLGEHGEQTHGLFAYEATLKVPLIVAGPSVPHRSEAIWARHVDIAPTILDAAGVKRPAELKGTSLFDAASSRDSYFEALSASLNRGWAPLTGILRGGTKYIDLPIAELYDLQQDPGETRNLREERRRDVEAARQELAPMLAASANAPRTVSPEAAASLRSLGYITGTAARKGSYTAADDPKNLVGLDAKMHQVIDAFQSRDLRGALRLAREVVAARPDMGAGRELLAFVLQQSEQVGEAMRELESMIAGGMAATENKVQLALLYSETGQPQRAVQLLAPLAGGNDPDVINAYGVALADSGRPDEGEQQFQRVLSIDPNNAPAYQNLGIAALKRDDVARAQGSLARALELNPRLPLALNALGVVYARQNDFPRAVEAWKRAVSIDRRQYDALLNIGLVEGRAGHREEARRALQAFVATAPPSRYAQDIAAAKGALASLR